MSSAIERLLAIVTLVVLSLGTASADGTKSRARAHVAKADIAYKAERYDEALVHYTDAHAIYPVPALLFNIGQCHRNLKHFDLAAEAYQGFLLQSPPTAPNRGLVEDLLAQVLRELAAERVLAAERLAALEASRRGREEAATRIEPAPVLSAMRVDTSRARPIYKKWWFWTALGVAAVAAGGAYWASSSVPMDPVGTLGKVDRR